MPKKRIDERTYSRWRTKSLEGYGNAIVPQIVVAIFQALDEILP